MVANEGDFIITEGRNKGKIVDLMFTADNQKQVELMNKNFDKNWPSIQVSLTSHLNKANYVPLDFRNLDAASKLKITDYLKTFPTVLQNKVIIME